jgi:hypothetical protein
LNTLLPDLQRLAAQALREEPAFSVPLGRAGGERCKYIRQIDEPAEFALVILNVFAAMTGLFAGKGRKRSFCASHEENRLDVPCRHLGVKTAFFRGQGGGVAE